MHEQQQQHAQKDLSNFISPFQIRIMSSLVAALNELSLKGQTFTPRWGLSAAYVQGKVYIFGGYLWFHGVEGFFHDLYELDISEHDSAILPKFASSSTSD